MPVTKVGLIGASRHNRGSRTIGQGLSESRGLGLVRKYISTLVRDRLIY